MFPVFYSTLYLATHDRKQTPCMANQQPASAVFANLLGVPVTLKNNWDTLLGEQRKE